MRRHLSIRFLVLFQFQRQIAVGADSQAHAVYENVIVLRARPVFDHFHLGNRLDRDVVHRVLLEAVFILYELASVGRHQPRVLFLQDADAVALSERDGRKGMNPFAVRRRQYEPGQPRELPRTIGNGDVRRIPGRPLPTAIFGDGLVADISADCRRVLRQFPLDRESRFLVGEDIGRHDIHRGHLSLRVVLIDLRIEMIQTAIFFVHVFFPDRVLNVRPLGQRIDPVRCVVTELRARTAYLQQGVVNFRDGRVRVFGNIYPIGIDTFIQRLGQYLELVVVEFLRSCLGQKTCDEEDGKNGDCVSHNMFFNHTLGTNILIFILPPPPKKKHQSYEQPARRVFIQRPRAMRTKKSRPLKLSSAAMATQ